MDMESILKDLRQGERSIQNLKDKYLELAKQRVIQSGAFLWKGDEMECFAKELHQYEKLIVDALSSDRSLLDWAVSYHRTHSQLRRPVSIYKVAIADLRDAMVEAFIKDDKDPTIVIEVYNYLINSKSWD